MMCLKLEIGLRAAVCDGMVEYSSDTRLPTALRPRFHVVNASWSAKLS